MRMKMKFLIIAALLLVFGFALLRFLWSWAIPITLVLAAVWWFTRRKKRR